MTPQILDYSENNGLVLCNKPELAQNYYERLYLFEISKLNAYAVLFRRFFRTKDDTSAYKSEPSVCVFLEEHVPVNSEEHFKIHAALWSEGKIDIYIILKGNTRVDIYNVRKPTEKVGNELSFSEDLKLASDSIQSLIKEEFSAKLFGQGTFWEQKENQQYLNIRKSPYNHLVIYLMDVRKKFSQSDEYDLHQETIDKLLVLTILIKFLEEKKDARTDKSTLDEIYSKYSLNSIEEIQDGMQLISIIEDLSNEFNGKIFQFKPEEKSKIRNTNLSLLSKFLKADEDINTGQLFLWKQYSFQHLPAEVISAIYENFIQAEAEMDGTGREKGVIYTPIHLVNFLIDSAMPLDNIPSSFIESGKYKILDPTCGSGVFLVAAYKRLLQWWAILEYKRTGKIVYPDVSIAQKILEDNIFGVDVKETAVRITIFGLTTALLEFLTPKEVWSKLKFKDLTYHNIVHAEPPTGFFNWAVIAKKTGLHFSLAIGNPPFNKEKKFTKEQVLDKEILKKLDLKHNHIPGNNFALHFFETAMLLADHICMIIPSNVLLYDKSASANAYRKALFSDYTINYIYDFTHLRRGLFTSADTPVLALVGSNKPSTFKSINHIVVKRTISAEQRTRFEIDEYDTHQVKWDWAVDPEKQFIWKTNLLGGGRLFHLIDRFKSFYSLKDFITDKEGWMEIRGFEGGSTHIIEGCSRVVAISENGEAEIIQNTTIETSRLKDVLIYEPPFLLIDQVLGTSNIPVFLASTNDYSQDQRLYYNRDFVGISVPKSDESLLQDIYNYFRRKNEKTLDFRFFIVSISSSSLVLTESDINKSEILSIPYSNDENILKLSDAEVIIQNDVLNYYLHLGKAIYNDSDGSVLHRNVLPEEVLEYGKVFCTELNDIYARDNSNWQIGDIFIAASITVVQFGFGVEGGLKHEFIKDGLDEKVEELINNEVSNRGATFRRIVRLYNHENGFDCVYFIKPNALRYWLKSIALRDADETFVDLRQKGY